MLPALYGIKKEISCPGSFLRLVLNTMNKKSLFIIVGIIITGIIYYFAGNNIYPKKNISNLDSGLIDCGIEDNQLGVGYSKEARDCFFEAYSICKPAKFVGTLYSTEGGKFINTLKIAGEENGKCKILKELDASDYWALGKKLRGYCYGLVYIDLSQGEFKEKPFFELKECDDSLENQTIN